MKYKKRIYSHEKKVLEQIYAKKLYKKIAKKKLKCDKNYTKN